MNILFINGSPNSEREYRRPRERASARERI